jgi:polar amino acid transport system substrate-binding protein
VISTKTIRVGYLPVPPAFIKDPNSGKYSGIFYDVLEQAAKNLELKLDFVEEVGWGTMVESLRANRIDLVCAPIWPNAQRAKVADFVNPLYFTQVRAWAREGDHAFDGNLAAANSQNVVIATIDGEMSSSIARFDFPKARESSLPQTADVSQLFLAVASGKAQITFSELSQGLRFAKNNPQKVREVAAIPPIRIFPNCMMVRKDDLEFVRMLNVTIEELINAGFVDKIIFKYEEAPKEFLRSRPPYIE